jgi:hypothetical protein
MPRFVYFTAIAEKHHKPKPSAVWWFISIELNLEL